MKRIGIFLITIVIMLQNVSGKEFDDYVIIRKKIAEVKLEGMEESVPLKNVGEGERYVISSYDKGWYEVGLDEDLYGYVNEKDVTVRSLQKDKALDQINEINTFVLKKIKEKKKIVMLNKYSYNPNLIQEKVRRDFEGRRLLYGVKGFEKKSLKSKWIYIGDRQLMAIEDMDDNGWVKISMPQRKKIYYIKKSEFDYSEFPKIEDEIKKFIVVDRKNQNVSLYEKTKKPQIIKSALSSTGYDNSKNSFRTPLGSFVVANLKDYMIYAGKTSNNELYNKGRAPYAVRFSGGNYLHGIPVEDDVSKERGNTLKKWRESLLGSYPLSHGCVRNSDEMAKEIFEWIDYKRTKDNYIYPTEVVSVVVIE